MHVPRSALLPADLPAFALRVEDCLAALAAAEEAAAPEACREEGRKEGRQPPQQQPVAAAATAAAAAATLKLAPAAAQAARGPPPRLPLPDEGAVACGVPRVLRAPEAWLGSVLRNLEELPGGGPDPGKYPVAPPEWDGGSFLVRGRGGGRGGG